MEATFGFICDQVTIDAASHKVTATGLFDAFTAQKYPSVHPDCWLVTHWEGGADEAGRDFDVRIEFVDQDGQNLVPTTPLQWHLAETDLPGNLARSNIICEFKDLPIPAAGTYAFKILINEIPRYSLRVFAIEVP